LAALKKGAEVPLASIDGPKGKAAAQAAAITGLSTSTVERELRKQREPESESPVATLPDSELHFRELAKDVRDMINKVLRHTEWDYRKRAWLCSKAGSKLAALARELSKQDKAR
jgi:hypothetical protein